MGQCGFWDIERRQQKLSQKRDFLDRLDALIPWEDFRPLLEQIHLKERKSNAGRKAIDVLLMFKRLILPQLYNISDEELE
ncbi:MAG: transposase [Synechococcales cyanobacterium T60_A2020_003]|nr:transposase [Synechococcales cyanobacterium T60_A2020_003]